MTCGRCRQAEAVEGKRSCTVCLEKLVAQAAKARAGQVTPFPDTDTERHCRRCSTYKPFNMFFLLTARTRAGGGKRLDSKCKDCSAKRLQAWRNDNGQQPMRQRKTVGGKLCCSLCVEWKPIDGFHQHGTYADGSPRRASRCKECSCRDSRQQRAMGNSLCECGDVKDLGEDACSRCLEIDGVTAPEGQIISALRVLGGEAQLAAIVEDIGGDINEDPDGSVHRRARRGLASIRERGLVASRLEKTHGNDRGEIATHRLKEEVF